MKTCNGCLSYKACKHNPDTKNYCIGLNRQWYISEYKMVEAGFYDKEKKQK